MTHILRGYQMVSLHATSLLSQNNRNIFFTEITDGGIEYPGSNIYKSAAKRLCRNARGHQLYLYLSKLVWTELC